MNRDYNLKSIRKYLGLIIIIKLVISVLGSLLFLSRKPVWGLTLLFWLFLYLLFMIIPSAQGWAPMVSFLKLALFLGFCLATICIATEGAAQAWIDTVKLPRYYRLHRIEGKRYT